MISSLPPLQKPAAAAQITRDTRVRHAPLAITHLRPALGTLDLTIPGEHIATIRAWSRNYGLSQQPTNFASATSRENLSDDVRIALVSRLVASGLLQVVT